jgi:SAM-dependent methyltransferase
MCEPIDPKMEALFRLHADLPRQGPGSDDATRDAIHRLPDLGSSDPHVMDIGCGTGKQTLVLARELNTSVTAIDIHEPFLKHLQNRAAVEGLYHYVVIRKQSMFELDDPPGSVDLIWSEGSIFIIGWQKGLQTWRPLLRDGGLLVVSEMSWLIDDRPPDVEACGRELYPAITDVAGNIHTAEQAGYEVFDHFELPAEAWWPEYLTPLEARIGQFTAEAETNPAMAAVLDDTCRELTICREHLGKFGYVFYLMRKQ